jgi:hypothetical protein
MRRFLTLVCLLCVAIPAGISISGCVRNPAGNYCNGEGYGLKDTDVASIFLVAADDGDFPCLRADAADCRSHGEDLQGRRGQRGFVYLRHHQQPAGGYFADRQPVRGNVEPQHRRRHCQLHDLQLPQSAAIGGARVGRNFALRFGLHNGFGQLRDVEPGGGFCSSAGDIGDACRTDGLCLSQARRRCNWTRRPAFWAATTSSNCCARRPRSLELHRRTWPADFLRLSA